MTTLNTGSTGAAVAQLQNQLSQAGIKVLADGHYGPKTAAAVAKYQQKNRLMVDGIAGPKTQAMLAAQPAALTGKLLTEADIVRAAKLLGVNIASIKAVHSVESAGAGFLTNDKPKILFERHQFKKHLLKTRSKQAVAELERRRPNLISSQRGGYQGGVAEWVRYSLACGIDAEAAALSTSWGAYQIMGFNYAAAGFTNVSDFVTAMHQTEGDHLLAFCRFIQAHPLMHRAMTDKRWAAFARLYNGPAYKDNLYDVKLARAYLRFGGDT